MVKIINTLGDEHYIVKLCDFGSFSKDTIEVHNNSEKHKTFILRNKK